MTAQSPEIVRLAYALRIAPDQLSYLDGVPDEDVRDYRTKLLDELLAAARNGSSRAAKAAKLLPVSTAAKIADRTGSPFLTARIAGEADEAWTLDIGKRLSPDLIAGVIRDLAPDRSAALLGAIGLERAREVVGKLAGADDWVPLADLIVRLPADVATGVVESLDETTVAKIDHLVEPDYRDTWLRLRRR